MSIRRMIQDLNDLKFSYSGQDLARVQSAIDSLSNLGTSNRSYTVDDDGYSRDYQKHGLMGPPSASERGEYSIHREKANAYLNSVEECRDCQPGRPCYGHGHY